MLVRLELVLSLLFWPYFLIALVVPLNSGAGRERPSLVNTIRLRDNGVGSVMAASTLPKAFSIWNRNVHG